MAEQANPALPSPHPAANPPPSHDEEAQRDSTPKARAKSKVVLQSAIRRHFGRAKASHFAQLHDVVKKLKLVVFQDDDGDDR